MTTVWSRRIRQNTDLRRSERAVEEFQSRITELRSETYEAPEPVSYELQIKTDDSGNNTTSETLSFTISEKAFNVQTDGSGSGQSDGSSGITTKEKKITFHTGTDAQTVYDTQFAGYDELVTIMDKNSPSYTPDTPDSESVQVD